MVNSLRHPSPSRRLAPTLIGYLGRAAALDLVLTLAALGAFIGLLDIVDLLGKAAGKSLGFGVLLKMSLFKLPTLMMDMLPFAVLLATLATLWRLNRRSELVALRAAGLPVRRIVLGPFLVILFTGLVALTIINPLAATLLKRYETWSATTFPGSARGLVTEGGTMWLRQQGTNQEIFIYAQKVQNSGQRMEGVTLLLLGADGTFRGRVEANEMVLEPGQWRLPKTRLIAPPDTQGTSLMRRADNVVLPTTLTPAMIQSSFNPPGTLSVWQLRQFIHVLQLTGFPSAPHAMAYNKLLALPAFLVAMFMLAVPFAVGYGRNKGLAHIMGAGLALGFGFYLFATTMAGFGIGGRLNPILAAWAPTLMAALLAAILLLWLREE
jgi:lipopolysaccharide export system permease protein